MQTTYASRLRQARSHAGLSQAELARRLGLKPQAVQYLEADDNNARGSRNTPRIARECGVDPIWLESGTGVMLPRTGAESSSRMAAASPKALAIAIAGLPPELRQALTTLIAALRPQPNGRTFAISPGEVIPESRARTRRASAA
jgi:transcriptional regulator with XRE-family HTH domain